MAPAGNGSAMTKMPPPFPPPAELALLRRPRSPSLDALLQHVVFVTLLK
jgi:hypothetical protein